MAPGLESLDRLVFFDHHHAPLKICKSETFLKKGLEASHTVHGLVPTAGRHPEILRSDVVGVELTLSRPLRT